MQKDQSYFKPNLFIHFLSKAPRMPKGRRWFRFKFNLSPYLPTYLPTYHSSSLPSFSWNIQLYITSSRQKSLLIPSSSSFCKISSVYLSFMSRNAIVREGERERESRRDRQTGRKVWAWALVVRGVTGLSDKKELPSVPVRFPFYNKKIVLYTN